MKALKILFAATAFSACVGQVTAGPDDHKPMHGGIVVPGKQADFELVAKPDVIHLYLQDHGKPLSPAKASAKLTLLNGSEKQDVTLAPAGDKLEAKGSFKVGAGTKVVAVVTNEGKSFGTARFTLK